MSPNPRAVGSYPNVYDAYGYIVCADNAPPKRETAPAATSPGMRASASVTCQRIPVCRSVSMAGLGRGARGGLHHRTHHLHRQRNQATSVTVDDARPTHPAEPADLDRR